MTERRWKLWRWILFGAVTVLIVWLAPLYARGDAADAIADLWLAQEEDAFTDLPSPEWDTVPFDVIFVTDDLAEQALPAGIDGAPAAGDHPAVRVSPDCPAVPEPLGFGLWVAAFGVTVAISRMRPKSACVRRERLRFGVARSRTASGPQPS